MKRGHRDVAEGNQTLAIVSPWNVITLQRLLHQRQGSPSRASVFPMSPEGDSQLVLVISMFPIDAILSWFL